MLRPDATRVSVSVLEGVLTGGVGALLAAKQLRSQGHLSSFFTETGELLCVQEGGLAGGRWASALLLEARPVPRDRKRSPALLPP